MTDFEFDDKERRKRRFKNKEKYKKTKKNRPKGEKRQKPRRTKIKWSEWDEDEDKFLEGE